MSSFHKISNDSLASSHSIWAVALRNVGDESWNCAGLRMSYCLASGVYFLIVRFQRDEPRSQPESDR